MIVGSFSGLFDDFVAFSCGCILLIWTQVFLCTVSFECTRIPASGVLHHVDVGIEFHVRRDSMLFVEYTPRPVRQGTESGYSD